MSHGVSVTRMFSISCRFHYGRIMTLLRLLVLVCVLLLFHPLMFVTELAGLIKFVRPFLGIVSKAKAAKLVRSLVDMFLDMEAGTGKEVSGFFLCVGVVYCIVLFVFCLMSKMMRLRLTRELGKTQLWMIQIERGFVFVFLYLTLVIWAFAVVGFFFFFNGVGILMVLQLV